MPFVNPIGSGLRPERVDQGVDYGGSGALYAMGDGTITNVYNSGWPGGTFIALHLADTGQYLYYAEDINPAVKVGERVRAGQVVGHATGGSSGIEVGWAAGGSGNTMASKAGQTRRGQSQGDPGKYSTGFGVAFNNLLIALGAKGGQVDRPIQGTAPAEYGPSGASGVQTTAVSLPNPLNPGSWFGGLASALGIDPKDMVQRFGLILLGGALVILGLAMLTEKKAMQIVGLKPPGGSDAKTSRNATEIEANATESPGFADRNRDSRGKLRERGTRVIEAEDLDKIPF